MPAGNVSAPVYVDEGRTNDLYGPHIVPKKDKRSKLLRSKEAYAGHIVNACPFGCADEELDAEEFCRHVVGFTCPDDDTLYQPLQWRPTPKGVPPRYRFVDGTQKLPVQPADRLVPISTCSRVYRPIQQAKPSE